MEIHEEFYRNGIIEVDFSSKQVNGILGSILRQKIKEGFSLESKYGGTLDLRPSVLDYDDSFIEVLKQNNIPKIIENATLRDYSLYHIQVRVTNLHNYSYMDWHRDLHYHDFKEEPQSGVEPPAVKLIYYPHFENNPSEMLKFLVGSNKTMLHSKQQDYQLINYLKTKTVSSSDSRAILFDTSSMHAVIPDSPGVPSIRLIYSFLHKNQIEQQRKEGKNKNINLHLETMRRYEDIK
jgi:hypothetical protein